MKKYLIATIFTLSAMSVFGQSTGGDYKKVEVFAGYSHQLADVNKNTTPNNIRDFYGNNKLDLRGVNASAVYNVNRYFGAKFDFSVAARDKNIVYQASCITCVPIPLVNVPTKTKNSLYNFLGGVQVKDNASTARLKPFGHALIGAGYERLKVRSLQACPVNADCTQIANKKDTGLAGAFGGGLDVKLADRFDIRAIQVDYNPIRFDRGTTHNVRLGVGIVFK